MELARANKMDSTVPWILAAVSGPGMLVKQYINIIQMVRACQWLAEGDLEEREKLGLNRKSK